jgi:hypothetical protein
MFRERDQMGPVAQVDDDNRGFARWAQGRPPPAPHQGHTLTKLKLLVATGKLLGQITLADFQAQFSLLAPASQGRVIKAAKCLCSFAQRINYLTLKPRPAIQSGLRLSALLLGEMS